MTAPRITRTGILRAAGREVDVLGHGALCLSLEATSDETEDARALALADMVRITIEPADATPEEAPHGSALDYLAEIKGLLLGMLETRDAHLDEQTERAIRRCKALANSVTLAILNERRK